MLPVTVRGETYRLSFLTTDFANQQKFKNLLNKNTISLSYLGSDGDLELLKGYVSELQWVRKTGVKAMGIYPHEGRLVFVSPDGAVERGGVFVDDIVQLERCRSISTGILSCDPLSSDKFPDIGKLLLTYNEPAKTVSILAWTAGCFIKPHLRKEGIKFPHLFLIGEAGSGKSTTMEQVILPVFSCGKVTASTQITAFTLMKEAASSNLIPMPLDEFKPSKMDKLKLGILYNHFRDAYDGHEGVRGRADQSVVSYELLAPMVVAGEELMLTILASYAQEESLSVSENQKWRVRKNFEEGKPWNGRMLGYRYENGAFVVIPEEAEIVKKIFRYYLEGLGTNAIMKRLADEGINAKNGGLWGHSTLAKILRNYAYTGNLLLQRFYRENHLTKKTVVNNGELPKYQVNNSHEAIIDMSTFEAVQNEIARRAERYARSGNKERYPFSGFIVCGNCGKHFRRKVTPYNVLWICATYNEYGKAACESKAIPEATLTELVSDIPFLQITEIRALNGNTVVICKKDGSEIARQWQDRSRSESWTPEMKAEASKRNRKGERQWEQ